MTASMAMQLMAGANVIDVNQAMKEDRALFGGAQKVRYASDIKSWHYSY